VVDIRLQVTEHVRVQIGQVVLSVALRLDPRMFKRLLSRESDVGRPLQQLINQIFGLIAHLFPDLGLHAILAVEYVLNDVFVLLSTKWRLTAKHDEHNDSHTPNIALSSVASLQHFWCDVVRRTIGLVHNFVGHNSFGQAEVNQFDVAVVVLLVQQEVLWLDVSVADGVSVQVAKGVESLLHYRTSLSLSKVLLLCNVVKQFATFAEFSNKETNPIGLPRLKQLDDVGVV